MNMTEPAVSKSPRTIETVTAVASRTATESFPQSSALSPSRIYLTERKAEMTARTGSGRNSLENVRRRTVMASLSSYSRFRARGVCAGTRSIASAFWNENAANARRTAVRFSWKLTTASHVRSKTLTSKTPAIFFR